MSNNFCIPNLGSIVEILFIAALVGIAVGIFAIANLHSFLAKNAPIDADLLVVEGWLPDYALKAVVKEFKQGSYRQVVTIGGPIPCGSYLFQYKTFAELAAATLTAIGLEPNDVLAVPHNAESASRTYDMAIDLKQWLLSTNQEVNSLNLVTLGTHSRRSWILFRKSFEPQIDIGIIAVPPCHYDPLKWWQSSEGTRTILSEFIAYVYTRLLSINIL
jgi:DUF218 domain